MSHHQPFNYTISTLPLIVQDVEKRSYYFKKAYSLLQKKAEMDLNYSSILQNIIHKEYSKNASESIPTQYLYNRIVEYCLEQCKRIRKVGESLKHQSSLMETLYEREMPEQKKYIMLTQSISKDFTAQREKIQKSKAKFQKKNKELEHARIEYLCSYLGNEQLQKKNQLYLQVNCLQESTKPLREDYENLSRRYNQMVEMNVEQFKSILKRIEAAQSKKIIMLKYAVRHFLEVQKESLDQTLRHNPFRRATIDSINENKELLPHNDQIVNHEKAALLFPSAKQSQFVYSIYDRIQSKKNLEQIILYGQTKEHRQRLSAIMDEPNSQYELCKKTTKMIEIFKKAFEGQPNQQMYSQLQAILKNDEVTRKDFVLCLQKFRTNSIFQLKLDNKQSIIKCLNIFLDVCNDQLDTYNSKMLMVLSLTYYFRNQETKIQLQQLIKQHSIWRRIGWWQAALIQSIFQETKVKVKKEEIPITIWDIKAGGANRRQQGEEVTYQHICFNQVLYYIRNMTVFNLHPKQIIRFAKQNIAFLKFSSKLAKDILNLCPQNGSQHSLS